MREKPAIRPDLAIGDTLHAIARAILADARAAIEDATRPDAEAVHDFRREMKRWRAFLRLLGPFLGEEGRRLRTEARDLARALGGARDAQAALDGLDDVADHGLKLSGRSLVTLRKKIEDIRQSAESTILTGDTRLRLSAMLDEAEAAVARWSFDSLTFGQIADRLTRGYRAARRALPQHWADAQPENLHELRKRIVTHRYQMETVRPLWPRFSKMWIAEAQRLRERLGKHQDLLVLAKLTEPHQPLARWRGRLGPAVEQRKAEHVRGAQKLATRLLVEKPKAFRQRLEVMWNSAD